MQYTEYSVEHSLVPRHVSVAHRAARHRGDSRAVHWRIPQVGRDLRADLRRGELARRGPGRTAALRPALRGAPECPEGGAKDWAKAALGER